MRIIMTPVGSGGDVHPYVSVALALQQRGHDVSMIINPYFGPLLDRVGLPFVPIGTVGDYHTILGHPDLWHDRRGLHVLGGAVRRWGLEAFELLRAEAAGGPPVVVAPGLAFSARVAHETLGLPLVTMHLQPSCLLSAHEASVPHAYLRSINRWPAPLKRLALAAGDRVADRALAPAANALRAELGLPPVRHIVSAWWHSPQRVIGLFPDWYAAVQPDWPRQTTLTGFPLYDAADAAPLAPALDDWLSESDAAGRRPVVFVAGTGNRQASRFFQAGADACRRLGRPGLLLTRFPEQLPDPLPAGVRHADYAPPQPGAAAGRCHRPPRRYRHRGGGTPGRLPPARDADDVRSARQRRPPDTPGRGPHLVARRRPRPRRRARPRRPPRVGRHRPRLPRRRAALRGRRSSDPHLRADRSHRVTDTREESGVPALLAERVPRIPIQRRVETPPRGRARGRRRASSLNRRARGAAGSTAPPGRRQNEVE